jgi:hypothetical protein
MKGDLETGVVLKQTVLHGSAGETLQRVAVVYIDGDEYRVSAPGEAKGEALDWVAHFTVRQTDGPNSEIEVHNNALGILALKVVEEELKKQKRAEGAHPDGFHCTAQICQRGHVQHCDGMQFDSKAHCTKCGAACIDECPRCHEPIRGAEKFKPVDYSVPQYCHRCGRPYPWMEDRLQTAREFLRYDEKLTPTDRDELFDILQEVMSDPKSPLTPAKRKLIDIKLEKAAGWVKDLVVDLVAKTTAEVIKG